MKFTIKHILMFFMVALMPTTRATAQTECYEWSSLPFGGAGFVSGVITCPQEANSAILCSEDYGQTWQQLATVTEFFDVFGIKIKKLSIVNCQLSIKIRIFASDNR